MRNFLRLHPRVRFPLPFGSYDVLTGRRLICPVYHVVSDEPLPHIEYLYRYRGIRLFEDDLDFMLRFFEPIDAQTLYHLIMNGENPHRNMLFLSFDDGFREVYEIAAPILHRKGVPATLFITTSLLDNRSMMYRHKASLLIGLLNEGNFSAACKEEIRKFLASAGVKGSEKTTDLRLVPYSKSAVLDAIAEILEFDFSLYLREHRPYLETGQVQELQAKGFTVGSHSVDHPEFSAIEPFERIRQMVESLTEIQNRFSPPLRLFSFPFTDHGVPKTFFETIFRSGDSLVDLTFGCAGLKRDSIRRNIQRIPMESCTLQARDILTAEYTASIIRAMVGKDCIRR
ncbi:MAG: polysaccharide deacetylase family protein [Bacteroidota bacterium]|nr:polysaccharide deacetylase family protein [Bacteroidota bacterium]